MKTVVILVETNANAQIDQMYIDKAIKSFYVVNLDTNVKYIPVAGIDKLTNQGKEIERYRSGAEKHAKINQIPLDFNVIIVADTDNYDSDALQLSKIMNLKEYCDKKNYHFVWMCRDIEHVFLKRQVSKKEKVSEAKKYYSNKSVNINAADLLCQDAPFLLKRSNLFSVLDRIGLIRK